MTNFYLDKRVSFALSASGSIVSLAGLVIFFKNEKYGIFSVLVVITITLICAAIINSLKPKIKYYRSNYNIRIMDADGKIAKCTKEVELAAKQMNVNIITDRNFVVDGNLKFTGTNIGSLHGPLNEGANSLINTVLNTPLDVNKRVHKILYMEAQNTFTAEKENIAIQLDHSTDFLEMKISVPIERPFKNIEAYMYYNGSNKDISNKVRISEKRDEIAYSLKKVKCGMKINLMWTW